MNKLQRKLLDIAKVYKEVCEKHNLAYQMYGGTLLGAVRHKGFIPWDDDIDFIMPRSDYNRLLELFKADKNLFGQNLNLRYIGDGSRYYYPFYKLEDVNTTQCAELSPYGYLSYEIQGINIDIFPVGYFTQDNLRKMLKYYSRAFWYIFHRTFMPYYKPVINKKGIKRFYKELKNKILYSNNVISAYLIRHYRDVIVRDLPRFESSFEIAECIASPFTCCVLNKLVCLPKDLFIDSINLPFEDTEFAAPKEWDNALKIVFNDYMTIPPESEREIHDCGYRNFNLPYQNYDFKDYIYFPIDKVAYPDNTQIVEYIESKIESKGVK
ncbi:hypothetical protein DCO58_10850 [Helicobacter saguini]|uniref:LicD/FKTN/FKRP nucleotidyltransferase domain-containing protein n=1 Tax=Helicobacter saguini TaxID=1548018 RepID=A0A347VPU8_9HELI|nr:LicD family protein [Helicobacter saguini]MWV61203.1 hypothetical protein [Helicobacter saguini]MWV68130.1 hypothetical protein [Helicobacter saguini]MWV72307.1 hypothetical protein [Helicobacter saguini]TLD95345.1 hypothetical protein LS64_003125 [Helicobacter saguini]